MPEEPALYHSVIAIPETGQRPDMAAECAGSPWRQLAAHAALPTQLEEFQAALGATMLAGTHQELVTCDGPAGAEACVALCRDSGFFAHWRMAGDDEVFEPGDALFRDGTAAMRLARRLARERRPIEFSRVPAQSRLVPALRSAMRGRGLLTIRPATPSPFIALDDSWREPQDKFSPRRRSDFRRFLRRAEEAGEVAFSIHTPTAEQFDALFDEAIAVELRSWKREAGSAIASMPEKEAFFRQYLCAASEAGQCRIAFMRIGGKAVAMQLAVVFAGRYWLYKIGYDEDYRRCSPGNLLMLHAVGAAARAGHASFEFMGEAESWIADLWTSQHHECVRVRTYPFSAAGMAVFARDMAQWAVQRLRRKTG